MKTPIQYITVIAIACFMLIGCSSAKKMTQENTRIENEIQKKDSIKSTIINKVIEDKMITPIVQSQTGNAVLDSLVNTRIDEILSKLNTSKNSGDNNYKLIYDKHKKQLEFYAQVAQTKNENTEVNNQKTKIIIQEKKTPIIVENRSQNWKNV